MRRRIHSLLFTGLVVTVCGMALAAAKPNPWVDAASQRIERAEFDGALQALERAEASGALRRAEVLRVLELKALVYLALGRRRDADQSLTLLATLAPDYRFAPHTSPDLLTAFDFARQGAPAPPRLNVAVQPSPGGVVLKPRVTGDERGIVQSVRVRYRLNQGAWRWQEAGSREIPVGPGDRLEFAAQARGAGGVMLQSSVERYAARGEPEQRRLSTWLYVTGGALAVAAVVVGVVLLTGGDPRTQPTAPVLEGR